MASLGDLIAGALGGVVIAVVLMVFGLILPNLNQAAIGASAYALILIMPVIIAAAALIGIVMTSFGSSFR